MYQGFYSTLQSVKELVRHFQRFWGKHKQTCLSCWIRHAKTKLHVIPNWHFLQRTEFQCSYPRQRPHLFCHGCAFLGAISNQQLSWQVTKRQQKVHSLEEPDEKERCVLMMLVIFRKESKKFWSISKFWTIFLQKFCNGCSWGYYDVLLVGMKEKISHNRRRGKNWRDKVLNVRGQNSVRKLAIWFPHGNCFCLGMISPQSNMSTRCCCSWNQR